MLKLVSYYTGLYINGKAVTLTTLKNGFSSECIRKQKYHIFSFTLRAHPTIKLLIIMVPKHICTLKIL